MDDDETDVVTIGFVAGPAHFVLRCGGAVHTDDAPGRVPEYDRGHSIVAGGADDEQIIGTGATQEHSGGRMGG